MKPGIYVGQSSPLVEYKHHNHQYYDRTYYLLPSGLISILTSGVQEPWAKFFLPSLQTLVRSCATAHPSPLLFLSDQKNNITLPFSILHSPHPAPYIPQHVPLYLKHEPSWHQIDTLPFPFLCPKYPKPPPLPISANLYSLARSHHTSIMCPFSLATIDHGSRTRFPKQGIAYHVFVLNMTDSTR